MTKPALLVVADDLTGACDVAGALRGTYGNVLVDLTGDSYSQGGEAIPTPDVIAIDAGIRELSETDAYLRSDRMASTLAVRWPGVPQFLKIDSTLRGPWAQALAGSISGWRSAMASGETIRVVVCPAAPAQGRAIVGGVVHVQGTKIHPDLRAVLSGIPWHRSVLVDSMDASTEADLDRIVRDVRGWAGKALGRRVFWVGASGLAAALGREMVPRDESGRSDTSTGRPPSCRKVVTIIGSFNRVSRAQVHALTQTQVSTTVFSVDVTNPASIRPALRAAEGADGLVLAGGATARLVLDHLGVNGLSVGGEIEPGIPWSSSSSNGVVVVTKAGGFGRENSLVRCVETLYGKVDET